MQREPTNEPNLLLSYKCPTSPCDPVTRSQSAWVRVETRSTLIGSSYLVRLIALCGKGGVSIIVSGIAPVALYATQYAPNCNLI